MIKHLKRPFNIEISILNIICFFLNYKGFKMQTSVAYQEHTSLMKGLNLHSDFAKVREDYKEDFEKIYSDAVDSDVKLSNAKSFLSELSTEELKTLQDYTQLADAVVAEELSDEGAYNLFMHFYEKYDFNNDGITEDGSARNISFIPQNMDNNLKKAFVEAANNSEEDSSISIMLLTLDIRQVKYDLAQHIDKMSSLEKDFISENTSFDLDFFIQEQLNKPPKNEQITLESIQNRIDSLLNLQSTDSPLSQL